MKPPIWFFPSVMITLSLFTAAVYLLHGDVRRALYWLAATVITITVTF